jgi:hypothetical protein
MPGVVGKQMTACHQLAAESHEEGMRWVALKMLRPLADVVESG